MKKIIVTPAGRKKYLSILSRYLIAYQSQFDEWHLWCNTDVQGDIEYMKELEKNNSFIKVIPIGSPEEIQRTCHYGSITKEYNQIIYACTIPYFIQKDAVDQNAVYLRLDDDIVFIAWNSIKNIFEYRINNTENFLVYGNIVNNSAISHIHQNIGVLPKDKYQVKFDAFDKSGLYDGKFAEMSHENFFHKYYFSGIKDYYFEPYEIPENVPVSIQVISWWGKDYGAFGGIIPEGQHEETYQAVERPRVEKRKNIVYGNGLFCHYAAGVNRSYLNTTNILEAYKRLVDDHLGINWEQNNYE